MRIALSSEGTNLAPKRSGQRAICPACRAPVVARCGRLNCWHWSHLGKVDCDPWAEPISDWHLQWQQHIQTLGGQTEVVMTRDGQTHRADAVLNGRVIEFQHSSISVAEILAREAFYGDMVWMFDVRAAYEADRFLLRLRKGHETFRWKHPQRSIVLASKPAFFDLGGGKVLRLRKMYRSTPCAGWGNLMTVNAMDDGKPLRDQRTDKEREADYGSELARQNEEAYQRYGVVSEIIPEPID